MAHTYIPRRQMALQAASGNAATLLLEEPFRFGITPEQAQHFKTYADDFSEKLAIAAAPGTGSRAAVAAKEESRLRMLYIMRPLLQDIKMNMGVTELDKVSLGLLAGSAVRARVPAPSGVPELLVIASPGQQHLLRYHDSAAPTRKAKPAGVAALEVWCQLGGDADVRVDNARHLGLVTRQPYVITFGAADVGKIVHYWARWVTRRGLTGPWSQVFSLMVAG